MDCSFCGKAVLRGTGKIFVKKDGTIFNFCSMKCEKNLFKLNRKPSQTKWTNYYHKAKTVNLKAMQRRENLSTEASNPKVKVESE